MILFVWPIQRGCKVLTVAWWCFVLTLHSFDYRVNGKSESVQGSQSLKAIQWLISEPLLVRYLFFCNSSVTECNRLFSCANMSKIGIFCKPPWCKEERSLSPLICTKHAGIESSWRLQIWLEWADWLKHGWMPEQCNPIHSVFLKKPGWASGFGSASSCNLMCSPEPEGSEGKRQCKALGRCLFWCGVFICNLIYIFLMTLLL